MINIKEKARCCGCSACQSVCPVKCINLISDNEGFLYPNVDSFLCVNCGLCERVCPINNHEEYKEIEKSFILRSKDINVLKESSSGGFFTGFSKYILAHGGVVYGVGLSENKAVIHMRVDREDDIPKLRGSKYVQSEISGIFESVKKDLKNKRLVGFSGTPCQVNGLHNYLEQMRCDTSNLITVDLICHGVSSPSLWKSYVEYQEQKNNSKVEYVNFRYKTYGYHSGSMKIIFQNGKRYYGSARVDLMLKSFFREISSRPSCYECNFKALNRVSDFTVFDGWHYSELSSKKDDDKGYTNVLVNTNKGLDFFNHIAGEYVIEKTNYSDAIKSDGIMYSKSAMAHDKRFEFYNDSNLRIEERVQNFIPVSTKDKLIEKLKSIYYFNKKIK